jgi:Nup85 Nucleoporin
MTLQLFSSKLAPKRLWVQLLLDTLPLLKRPEPVFNAEQTYQLMECLETVLLSHRHDEFMASANLDQKTGASGQLAQLSLALTTNLANAFLQTAAV